MALRREEARILGCLIEKEATVPDSYPLTLNALRLACNQSTNRRPVVAYDDRTVENALLSLKSMGLVRFVHPSHGGRTTRYRHSADERWHLSPDELGVLAALVLRGPQTVPEVRARVERHLSGESGTVEDILDTLAARSPEPLATRLERRPGERDTRFAHLLTGEVEDVPRDEQDSSASSPVDAVAQQHSLEAEVAALRARLDRLERLLGVEDDDEPPSTERASGQVH
jgi:uncharacterized protein YceH (UPF0502 family)